MRDGANEPEPDEVIRRLREVNARQAEQIVRLGEQLVGERRRSSHLREQLDEAAKCSHPEQLEKGLPLTTTAPRHRHLSQPMRDALRAARSQPLRRVHKPAPGKPPWPAHPSRLAALVRRDLLRRSSDVSRKGYRMDVWTITDTGLQELEVVNVTKRPGPLLLAVGWPDFTRDTTRAMRGEPGLGPLPDDEPESWAA